MVASEAILEVGGHSRGLLGGRIFILESGVDLLSVAVDGLDVAELVVVLEVDVKRDLEQLLQVLLARRRRRVLQFRGEGIVTCSFAIYLSNEEFQCHSMTYHLFKGQEDKRKKPRN